MYARNGGDVVEMIVFVEMEVGEDGRRKSESSGKVVVRPNSCKRREREEKGGRGELTAGAAAVKDSIEFARWVGRSFVNSWQCSCV